MRRKLFTIGAGISALLLIAVAGFWVRGYFRGDDFLYRHIAKPSGGGMHVDELTLASSRGRLQLEVTRLSDDAEERWSRPRARFRDGFQHGAWSGDDLSVRDNRLGETAARYGFGLVTHPEDSEIYMGPFDHESDFAILAPAWFLALLFAILPALRIRRYLLDRQRNRPGFCQKCGYDLRATPLRCPECGLVVGQ